MTDAMIEDVFSILRDSLFFHSASDAGLRALAAKARIRRFVKDEFVVNEGDPADGFGLILSGAVPSYQLSSDGRRLQFKAGHRGENVGLTAAVAGSRYPFHYEASTDATLAWFSRESLMALLEQEPPVAITMLIRFADLTVSTLRTNRNMTLDVPSRVADYLFGRAVAAGKKSPEGLSVPLGIYKSDLASYLNTVPETLSRAFATLTKEGLIEVHGGTVIVHDVGGLARRGEGLVDASGRHPAPRHTGPHATS